MLCLSRKLGEKIHIGEHITIVVTDIDRGKIRLGIEAPRDLPVMRAELLGGLSPEQRTASLKTPQDRELLRMLSVAREELAKLRAENAELRTRLTYHGADLVPHGPALGELDECEPAESETIVVGGV